MPKKDNDKVVDIRSTAEQRRQEEAEKFGVEEKPPEKKSKSGGPDDPRFVLKCLDNNERGDGILFAAMHRKKYIYIKSSGMWLKWNKHHWILDRLNESMTSVEQIAVKYLDQSVSFTDVIQEKEKEKTEATEEAERCSTSEDAEGEKEARTNASRISAEIARLSNRRKTINKRVNRLRTVRGATNCLTWSHNVEQPLAIVGNEIDLQPMLLATPNGVINLKTGQLRPGDPQDLLLKAVPSEFPESEDINDYLDTGMNSPCPVWEKFIREIHQDDRDLIDFVQRLLGYCLTGLRTEHFIACFLGEGANGKGTMFELLHDVLGELVWSIDPEMILEQKAAKSSSGPSPDIMSLYGRRLIIASETDPKRRVAAAKVKRLTGGDTLIGRAPHDRFETNFKPTHKLILYSNHVLKGLTADFAMFRRLLYLWYPLRYVDDPEHHKTIDPINAKLYRQKDDTLGAKLLAEKSGILAWLVRGCLLWQAEGGLNPPDKLRAAAEALRREEDHLERFLGEGCQQTNDPDTKTPFKDFYESFAEWYEENVDEDKRWRPSKKALGDQLRKKGYRVPPGKETGGTVFVYGLKLIRIL